MKTKFPTFAFLSLIAAAAPAAVSAQESGEDIFGAIHANDMAAFARLRDADPSCVTNTTESGMTPLHYAARIDRFEAAWRLLRAGAPVDAVVEKTRTTPLHWAADRDSVDAIRLLLAHGADPEARAANGFTPLHFAARHGSAAAVKRLLEAGADPSARDDEGRTPL
ncbi:MAG: ankyrin repeat domain-containing protein, partial [Kiritimatiellae bacterium]|nr:ankyrin repeat domain-containing protein [Kiritimatiellia bacterium]